jgi:hypothetical protein
MATTARGHIEQLPSGPSASTSTPEPARLLASRGALKQTCPDELSAAAALGKLLAQADSDHFLNREATLGQALTKYLEVAP